MALHTSGIHGDAWGCTGLQAGCMWLQGAELVEKQPGMAYALASVALSVGELQPLLWGCLLAALRTECCYTVPHYPALPPKGSPREAVEAYKRGIGYAQLRNGGFEKKERRP